MKNSDITMGISGYFLTVWYLLSLSNAFKGINIYTDFIILHAIGVLVFFFISAIFIWAEGGKTP